MKLLLDHNVSHKLVARLADLFPDSTQTRLLNFDSDVAELAILRGAPPKVVWLRMGNCRTEAVESALRRNVDAIRRLVDDPDEIVLEILE